MGEWFETADGATVTPREYLKNGVYVVDLMGAAYCYNGTFAGLRVSDGALALLHRRPVAQEANRPGPEQD